MDIIKVQEAINKMKVDGSFDTLFEEIIKKEKDEQRFILTREFKRNFWILKEYLKSNESFVTDGVFYMETAQERIFANNAIQIFNAVSRNAEEIDSTSDIFIFPTTTYAFDGVCMSCTFGQGCFYKFWLEK